ncbi:hypothetical protein I4U23_020220 [Adineta vaga]|nr:hypothetical protein I4U23_020220 [Adineta vaga]
MAKISIYRNQKFEEMINNCKIHSRIDLRKQKLTDSDIEFIIQEAIIKKQCTMLWLVSNQITSHSVSILASILEENSNLEGLSLCQNSLGDSDILYLTQALSSKKSKLNRLALTSNEISDQGVEYLANMLRINHSLTQLWLGFNKISDHGVKILADILSFHNQTLHVLSLSWNTLITDSCIDYLITMFEYNETLRTVCLTNCNLSDMGKKKLREATKLYKEFYLDL